MLMGPGFDSRRPPPPELIADCVHCGFCLPTCPTYLLWEFEPDSPRGRIDLMKGVAERDIGLSPETVERFDNCLGCMACVTACPSGVQYDRLIERTRAQVERNVTRSPVDRLLRDAIFALFPYPDRLRTMLAALRIYRMTGVDRLTRRILPARLMALETLLPPLPPAGERPPDRFTPARGASRLRVGVVSGCVQRVFFNEVNRATVRVLAAEGCDVVMPSQQGCCGALELHAGRDDSALGRARRLIEVFEGAGVDRVIINAAACGSILKEYGELLADDARWSRRAARFSAKVRDISELLAELEPVATYHPIPARVAYHDACHLQHAQGIRLQPRVLLRRIPDLELAEIAESEICCGSAGIYNLVKPEPARALGDRKAAQVLETRADALVSSNPGCLIQVHSALARAGQSLPAYHLVELLDASIRGITPPG
jgi:glycolate oxidase iron-sulfur subunit